MKWNMFADEVALERQHVQNYGVKIKSSGVEFTVDNRDAVSSYKGQALREMAKRLILEEKVINQQVTLNLVVNFLDGVSVEDMAKLSGMSLEDCQKLKDNLTNHY